MGSETPLGQAVGPHVVATAFLGLCARSFRRLLAVPTRPSSAWLASARRRIASREGLCHATTPGRLVHLRLAAAAGRLQRGPLEHIAPAAACRDPYDRRSVADG